MKITHDKLDTPIRELYEGAENKETIREFVLTTEETFGMERRNLDSMSVDELNMYVEFLDELWNK